MSNISRGGPKTALGKRRASRNAWRHGLSAKFFLSAADEVQFNKLSSDFVKVLKPKNVLLDILCQDVANSEWRKRVAFRFEQQELRKLFAPENEESAEKPQGGGGSFPSSLKARQKAQYIALLDALKVTVERRGSLPSEFEQPVTEAFGPNFWKTLTSWAPLNPVAIILASLCEHGVEISETFGHEMPEAGKISSEDKKKCVAAISVMRKEMISKIIDIYSTTLINMPQPVASGGAMLPDERWSRLDLAMRYSTTAHRDFYRALREYREAKDLVDYHQE